MTTECLGSCFSWTLSTLMSSSFIWTRQSWGKGKKAFKKYGSAMGNKDIHQCKGWQDKENLFAFSFWRSPFRVDCGHWEQTIPIILVLDKFRSVERLRENANFRRHSRFLILAPSRTDSLLKVMLLSLYFLRALHTMLACSKFCLQRELIRKVYKC